MYKMIFINKIVIWKTH